MSTDDKDDPKISYNTSGITFSSVPAHVVRPRKSRLDAALEDLGLIDPEWAPDDPIAPESACDDESHYGPYCRCC